MSIRINIPNTQKKDSQRDSKDNSDSVFEEDSKIINKPKVSASNANDLSKLDISGIFPKKSSSRDEDSISNINIESLAIGITQGNVIQEKEKEYEIDKNAEIRLTSPLKQDERLMKNILKEKIDSKLVIDAVINSERMNKKLNSNKK
jgi:hypothetical protein